MYGRRENVIHKVNTGALVGLDRQGLLSGKSNILFAAHPPARCGLTLFRLAAQADVFSFEKYKIFLFLRIKSVARKKFIWYNRRVVKRALVVKRLRRRPLTAQSRVRASEATLNRGDPIGVSVDSRQN